MKRNRTDNFDEITDICIRAIKNTPGKNSLSNVVKLSNNKIKEKEVGDIYFMYSKKTVPYSKDEYNNKTTKFKNDVYDNLRNIQKGLKEKEKEKK